MRKGHFSNFTRESFLAIRHILTYITLWRGKITRREMAHRSFGYCRYVYLLTLAVYVPLVQIQRQQNVVNQALRRDLRSSTVPQWTRYTYVSRPSNAESVARSCVARVKDTSHFKFYVRHFVCTLVCLRRMLRAKWHGSLARRFARVSTFATICYKFVNVNRSRNAINHARAKIGFHYCERGVTRSYRLNMINERSILLFGEKSGVNSKVYMNEA